jgi:hypothetical protein
MRKAIIGAAAAAALIAVSMAVPVQARMFDPTLNSTVVSTTVNVAWHHHYRRYGGWRHSYARGYRHWNCWTDWHGFRHCGWRY